MLSQEKKDRNEEKKPHRGPGTMHIHMLLGPTQHARNKSKTNLRGVPSFLNPGTPDHG